MERLIFLAVFAWSVEAKTKTCVSELEVRGKVCWALCRQEGFDTGTYRKEEDSCLCGNFKKWEDATATSLKVTRPQRVIKGDELYGQD